MSAVRLTSATVTDPESIVRPNWFVKVTLPEGPASEMVSFLYRCVMSKVFRRGLPNSNAHELLLGKISNDPSIEAPPTCMVPIHLPSEGTNNPFAMRRMRLDFFSFDSLCFLVAKTFKSITLIVAPSSKTPRNRTISPFGPSNATPWMKGLLSSNKYFPDSVATV